MYLTQPLHKGRRELPHVDAVVFGDRRATFSQFADRVSRLAAGLRALGVEPDDRVGMLSLNSMEYVEYFYGVWWAGGVINPVNIRWSPREVAYSLDDCDTRVLLVDDTFAAMVPALRQASKSLKTVVYCGRGETSADMLSYEELLATASPLPDTRRGGEDLAAVMYTGGTTGMPKGVMLTHTNLFANGLSAIATVSRKGVSRPLVAAPMFHVAGCGLALQSMMRLATQVILPMFDEVATLQAIQDGCTDVFLVPTMIKRVIDHPRFSEFDVSGLNMLLYGAAPIDAALLERAMQAFPNAEFCQAYGMTELSPTIAVLPPENHLPGPDQARMLRAAGRPVIIAEVRIVDADDNEVPVGQVGEITARGPMVMKGYWNKPEETAAALRGGWMHTGDMGYVDDEGLLYVVDRKKDMIVTGGENVYSAEVENAISQLEEVALCAVIGVPDEKWGERVHAVLVLRPGAQLTEEAVIAHCREQIAGYKCPRSVEFRDELPLSAAGKLQKFQLREPYWAGRDRRVA